MSSNRKFIIKKQPAPFDNNFKIVKVASPRGGDVELVGKSMNAAETKKFVETMDRNTIIEIVGE